MPSVVFSEISNLVHIYVKCIYIQNKVNKSFFLKGNKYEEEKKLKSRRQRLVWDCLTVVDRLEVTISNLEDMLKYAKGGAPAHTRDAGPDSVDQSSPVLL